jgi:tRNA(Ile)-lysidine synthase
VNDFRYPLSIPGEARIAESGVVITAELAGSLAGASPGPDTAVIAADRVAGGLAVRNRRPGDRFRPPGLGGRKKLQDFFVDRKVARAERARVPLVVDADDRIVWVVGHAVAEEFRVSDPRAGVLLLRARPLGDPA